MCDVYRVLVANKISNVALEVFAQFSQQFDDFLQTLFSILAFIKRSADFDVEVDSEF